MAIMENAQSKKSFAIYSCMVSDIMEILVPVSCFLLTTSIACWRIAVHVIVFEWIVTEKFVLGTR